MQKIIKLSDIHYIIVDDSEIKEGDFVWFNNLILQTDYFDSWFNKWEFKNYKISPIEYQKYYKPLKITHSTQPLNEQCQNACSGFCINCPDTSVKRLDLLEVEEAIYGYSVEKLAEQESIKNEFNSEKSFIKGFKAHQELVKDKLFITDKNLFDFLYFAKTHSQYSDKAIVEEFKQSLLPKTEWDIEFDEQGKIKLI